MSLPDAQPLTNALRKQLRLLASRQGRRKSDSFIAEGLRCGGEALARRPDWVEAALLSADFDAAGCPALAALPAGRRYVADAKEFAELAQTESPQGLLLLLRRPDTAPTPPADPFVLVLDRIGDPGNVGTMLRTAWAVGLREVAITAGSADAYAAKTVRAGMGAQFAVAVRQFADLDALRAHYAAHGYGRCWLTTPHGGADCFGPDFDLRRGLLVLGNEAAGVDLSAVADRVRIPMPGSAESLNVAQAATILLFDAVRRGILA